MHLWLMHSLPGAVAECVEYSLHLLNTSAGSLSLLIQGISLLEGWRLETCLGSECEHVVPRVGYGAELTLRILPLQKGYKHGFIHLMSTG